MKRRFYLLIYINIMLCIAGCASDSKIYSGKNFTGTNTCFRPLTLFYNFLNADDDNGVIITLMLIKIMLIILYFTTILKYRRQKVIQTYMVESRISKQLHDEVASQIYGAINHIENNETITGKEREKLMDSLHLIYHSTRNISRETACIDTGQQYTEQLRAMIGNYSCRNINIILKGIDDVNWDKVDTVKKITLYRILQELMINMKKHSEATVAIIEFLSKNKNLSIRYKDNGKGIPDKYVLKNGLYNVENRMETLGGNVIFEHKPGKGLHLTLTFPAPKIYV